MPVDGAVGQRRRCEEGANVKRRALQTIQYNRKKTKREMSCDAQPKMLPTSDGTSCTHPENHRTILHQPVCLSRVVFCLPLVPFAPRDLTRIISALAQARSLANYLNRYLRP